MYKSEQYKKRLERATKRREVKGGAEINIIFKVAVILILLVGFYTVFVIATREMELKVCSTATTTLAQQLKCNEDR